MKVFSVAPAVVLPCQHGAAPMVVEETKAMTGAKSNKVPLSIQRHRGNRGRGHALHEDYRLESRSEHHRARLLWQPVVTLPRETFPVLEEVHGDHIDHVIGFLVTQVHHDHLREGRGDIKGVRGCPPRLWFPVPRHLIKLWKVRQLTEKPWLVRWEKVRFKLLEFCAQVY